MPADAGIGTIGPGTIRQLNLFAHKAVLALYFEHFRTALPVMGGVCAFWKSKEDFALRGLPANLLNIMSRYATLVQGTWDARETFEYHFQLNDEEGLFACAAKLRNGLFVIGFAVADMASITEDVADWIAPTDPATVLAHPRVARKN